MTIPLWCLMGFALWTMALVFLVGGHRAILVVTGHKPANAFPADEDHGGPGWYRRARRAHLNCVENLPIFGALVFVAHAASVATPMIDNLAIAYLAARLGQSLVHIASVMTMAINVRFTFFLVQLICLLAMATEIAMAY